VLLFQVMNLCSGIFLFCNSALFFSLCASFMPLKHDVVVEARCNWYLHDINISRKRYQVSSMAVTLLSCQCSSAHKYNKKASA
jgi:hypothetical protein